MQLSFLAPFVHVKRALLAVIVIAILVVAVLAALVVFTNGGSTSSSSSVGAASTASSLSGTVSSSPSNVAVLNKVESGLIVYDPLNQYATQQQLEANGSYWSFGGTINSSAYYNFFENAQQLNIGIVAPNPGEWSGFYAVTPPTNAELVHAVLTASNGTIPGYYDTGLYMQATNQLVNYITCLAITTPNGTTWGVVHGQGTTLANVVITPLWVDTSPNQPLTRDCTLATNGQSYVRVYLDGVEVYSSNTTNLGMPGPYNFFVEEESEYAGHILYGGYQDFYAALNDTVTVDDIPSSGLSVALVNASGQVYQSAPVSKGTAAIEVGQYNFPLSGYVKVYSSATPSNSTVIASTPLEQVYGGDVYSFGTALPKTVSLTVSAQDTTGHDLNGFYITVTQGRTLAENGSTPWTFSKLNSSQTYTVTAYDYGSYVFDHWSTGSTSRVIDVSPTKSTNLVAIYRDVNSAPPTGTTEVTVSAVDSSGSPVTGLAVTIWQDGVLYAVSYTPANIDLTTGTTYLIAAAGYGNYTFSHWNTGSTNTYYQFTPQGATLSLVATYGGP